jgi:hypothetical protein
MLFADRHEEQRMMGRPAVLAALIALAGCAGVEPVGRNAQRAPAPVAAEAPPQPAPSAVSPPPQAPPPAQAAAPQAAPAPTPTPPTETASAEEDNAIVVPGQRDVQVPPPAGDPRSVAERTEDVRAWDQCVTQVQSAFEHDPMRPQLDSPEEYCSRSLGMANRMAVPESRRTRR